MGNDYRTDVDDVRRLLHRENFDTTGVSASQIEAYIDDANMVVDEDLEPTGQSDRRLKKIEGRLAGHFLIDSDIDGLRQEIENQTDRQRSRYAEPEDVSGYKSTSLGRQAVSLDQSGTLAEAEKRTVSIGVPEVNQRLSKSRRRERGSRR